MREWLIRPVEQTDLPLLDTALRALSKDLGDKHLATMEMLALAGFGPTPAYHAQLAVDATGTLGGAVLFSPVMSTSMGAAGLYVSDLWVAPNARGSGVGRRLLAQAGEFAHARWGASYLKLAVYHASKDARQFYDRLGFVERTHETTLFLDEIGLSALKGT
jgi:ribosomal protein S18 acetylase RimI-like enzyme